MNLLHIDASITGAASVSRQLSAAIVDAAGEAVPNLRLVRRDLDADPIPHLDSRALPSVRPTGETAQPDGEAARNAAILQEFLDADVVVIGAPMYNFTIASQLKAWIDRILVAGKTFRYTENGPQGLAGGKKVIIASTRGGLYAPATPNASADFQEPYLRTIFRFIGIDDVTIVRAEGVAFGPEQRQAALDAGLAAAPGVVAEFAKAMAA
jgi:FMN-dependent NADH-azoreductase